LTDYRQVGGRLGAYIRANNPSTQQIQGLLADMLAGDELLLTMKDVVGRPSFQALQALAGCGSGTVQLNALLQELSRRYLPVVIEEVNQLLNGMLDLKQKSPETSADNKRDVIEAEDHRDPWEGRESVPAQNERNGIDSAMSGANTRRQLTPSEICDENLWNTQRDPETDKRFLKAWNLRWFNKRYRPRLERD